MRDKEKDALAMFDKSAPNEEELFNVSLVNHMAWCLAVAGFGLALWLAIALVNAENLRYAMASHKCVDPVFKGEFDKQCLVLVRSREHWWQHLTFAMTHVTPER
ncbi:MAG: hypothetical protein V4582_17675 [Pseudomonadota bacterium]